MSGRRQAKAKASKTGDSKTMIFTTKNYQILGLAMVLLLIGFGGMYIEQEFTGWFSLYISPILIVSGFVTVAVAILFKDTSSHTSK
jgi:cytochrome c biogenesis protein CcdA